MSHRDWTPTSAADLLNPMNVANPLHRVVSEVRNATHPTLCRCPFRVRIKSCLRTLQHRLPTILKPKYRTLTSFCLSGYPCIRSTSQSQSFTHKKLIKLYRTTKHLILTLTKTTAAKLQVMTHKCRSATLKQSKRPHQVEILTTTKGQWLNRLRSIQLILRLAINPLIPSMSNWKTKDWILPSFQSSINSNCRFAI